MVTMISSHNVTDDGLVIASYAGLSTDTKPTDCGNGSDFIEMDSSSIYFYDGASKSWLKWG